MAILFTRTKPQRGKRLDALLLAALVLLAVALRLPSLGAPLGIDEGGMAGIGSEWLRTAADGSSSTSLYGDQWIDRPPLLLLTYGVADQLGGQLGVRILGMLAAAMVVGCVALIARRIGGRRAMVAAAVLAACVVSSPVLRGDMTYGELLASVPTAASVLLLIVVSTGGLRRGWHASLERAAMVAASGALAMCGPLIKQSAIDGIVAASLWLAWRAGLTWRARPARPADARARIRATKATEPARTIAVDAAAWLAGALVPVALLLAWARTTPGGIRDVGYALLGFRIDLIAALGEQSASPLTRAMQLVPALVGSGLVIIVLVVPLGLLAARQPGRGTAIAMLLGGWLAGSMLGVAGGGYYWGHYLLQLIAPVAVIAGLAIAGRPKRLLPGVILPVLLIAIAAPIVQAMAPRQLPTSPRAAQADPVAVGELLHLNGRPDDRVAVLYARANVAYYAGMQPATPYQWSSMYRALPAARADLIAALTGPDRAAWAVEWQRVGAFGMDRDGRVGEALAVGYRTVAVMCDHAVMLRTDRPLPIVTIPAERCHRVGVDPVAGGAIAIQEATPAG